MWFRERRKQSSDAVDQTELASKVQMTQAPISALVCLVLTIQVSFTENRWLLSLFVLVAMSSFCFLQKWQELAVLCVVPFLPACATAWSFYARTGELADASLLAERTYAFAAIGLLIFNYISFRELLLWAEQKGVSPTFVYGIYLGIALFPLIKREVLSTFEAARLRGKRLTIFSLVLWMKLLATAFRWRELYVLAMLAHGYREGEPRTWSVTWRVSRQQVGIWICAASLLELAIGWIKVK